MLPKQAIALAVLLARSHSSSELEIAEVDASSLLQVPVRQVQQLHMKAKGSQLLETAHTIISKVNAGDDPSGCSAASDATRTLVDELLPGILEQHSHWSNQGNIAAEAVENCVSQGGDLAQQGIDLQTARTNHQACRLAEHGLDESLGACQQYEELRTSLENRCFAFPNDEIEFPEAVQRARDELNVAFTQAQMLQQSCNTAREALAEQHAECDLEQRRFEEDYCAYRANCAGVQACHANALGTYRQTEIEAQAALESLRSEYQVLVHVQCLLGHADQALNQSAIVSGDAVAACSEPASTDELTISFPALDAVTTCESSIISQAPCRADFFESEYSNLPQREAIQAACVECPATTTTTTMTETESLSPSDELVDQDAGILPHCGWMPPADWNIEPSSYFQGMSRYHYNNIKTPGGAGWQTECCFENPAFLIFDAGHVVRMNAFGRVHSSAASGSPGSTTISLKDYTFFRSDDGEVWTEVISGSGPNLGRGGRADVEFPPVDARYWKLEIYNNYADNRYQTLQYVEFRLCEN